MVEEKQVEEVKGKHDVGIFITIIVVIMIVTVGMAIFNSLAGPFWKADSMRDHLDTLSNVSDDYRQGWLDCVNYYLRLETGPTNSTTVNGGKQ